MGFRKKKKFGELKIAKRNNKGEESLGYAHIIG